MSLGGKPPAGPRGNIPRWAAPVAGAALAAVYLALGGAWWGVALAAACSALTAFAMRPSVAVPEVSGGVAPVPDAGVTGVLGLIEHQIAVPPADLERVRGLIAGAATQLATSFGRIDELVRAQQRETLSLLSNVGSQEETAAGETGAVTVNQLAANVAETAQMLGQFVSLVVTLSKRSMDIFYRVEEATERLDAAQKLLEDVRWIANQTAMVAINATIESARLGEAGAGFAVVAGEVRTLAQRARTVSDEIGREITQSWQAAQAARDTTKENAAQDLTVLLTSRLRIESLADGVRALEQSIGDKLTAVTGLTGEVAAETSAACRSLQFEDITRQILERCGQDLASAAETVAAVRQGLEQPELGQDLVALAASLQAAQEARSQHKPGQETIAAGEVELF